MREAAAAAGVPASHLHAHLKVWMDAVVVRAAQLMPTSWNKRLGETDLFLADNLSAVAWSLFLDQGFCPDTSKGIGPDQVNILCRFHRPIRPNPSDSMYRFFCRVGKYPSDEALSPKPSVPRCYSNRIIVQVTFGSRLKTPTENAEDLENILI